MSKGTKAVLASWGRSFLSACLAQFIALGGGVFDLNGDALKTIVAAGLAAILPVILRWLNPNDAGFGVKAGE